MQHIALKTDDIIHSITHLRARGVEFIGVPATYYDALRARLESVRFTFLVLCLPFSRCVVCLRFAYASLLCVCVCVSFECACARCCVCGLAPVCFRRVLPRRVSACLHVVCGVCLRVCVRVCAVPYSSRCHMPACSRLCV